VARAVLQVPTMGAAVPAARSSSTKTIVITGGGRGLGLATAAELASRGHRVVLTARTTAATKRALEHVRARTPFANVEGRALDLSSLEQVRTFAARLTREGFALDALINCAGVIQRSEARLKTVDGFEQTLAVNVLAPFLLTHGLMPALRRSPEARVVNVSSRLHLPGSRGKPVDFDFDDPNLVHGYGPERAYKNSKLAMVWFTYQLQRRLGLSPVTANAVCPGFVPMTVSSGSVGFERWLMRHVLGHLPFARTVAQAVESFVFMALDPSLARAGGLFYADQKPIASSAESYDEVKAKRFWDFAVRATGSGEWSADHFHPVLPVVKPRHDRTVAG
jgi:retinol dehydrogenase 12